MKRQNSWKCPDGCPAAAPVSANGCPSNKHLAGTNSHSSEGLIVNNTPTTSPVISVAKVPKPKPGPTPTVPTAPQSTDETFAISANDVNSGGFLTEERFRHILKHELLSLKTQNNTVSACMENINEKFKEFQEALSFISNQFEHMKSELYEKNAVIETLEKKNTAMEATISDLSCRLTLVEQQLRDSNIEINGLPEHRTENLAKTVLQLAQTVKCDLKDNDVLHATRVAKMNKDNSSPRSVVVKLPSTRIRDTLLAAVTRFNKDNPKNKLSSEHIGIGGSRVPVFVAEHLTPSNKFLHAATRKKAKELGYKFVWVRNGRIQVRKDETSQAILIRSLDDLKKLK